MFCETWYLPHCPVCSGWTVRIVRVIMHISTAHAWNGHISTSDVKSDVVIASSTTISYKMRELQRLANISSPIVPIPQQSTLTAGSAHLRPSAQVTNTCRRDRHQTNSTRNRTTPTRMGSDEKDHGSDQRHLPIPWHCSTVLLRWWSSESTGSIAVLGVQCYPFTESIFWTVTCWFVRRT